MNRRNTAVLSVVIAMVAVACTSEDTSGGPSLTTSASAEPITPSTTAVQPGAQSLAWSKVFDVPAPFHVESIVETQGRFYALVKDIGAGDYTPSVVWASDDGTDWAEVDQLSEGASVQRLVASEDGLLALGFLPAAGGHRATAWYSSDGMVWDVCDLGYVVEPAIQPFTTSSLSFGAAALGSIGAVATATAFPAFDWDGARRAVAATLPDELAEIGIDWVGTTNESAQVTVGPFVVFKESLDTLGLGEVQEAQRITNSPAAGAAEEQLTFRTADLENWTVSEGNPMEAEHVETIASLGHEFVAAAGSLGSGKAKLFVSSDGQTWEPTGDLEGGLFLIGDRLLTVGWREAQPVIIFASADAGRTWEEVAGPDLSALWITAAGPAGVLATGTEGETWFGAPAEPAVIERNGFTVTFDSAGELFRVADSAGALLVSATLEMDDPNWGWGYTAPEELIFDFENETAAVQDPSTGETLVSLTFADLDLLGSSMGSYGFGDLLLFSPDAEQWTVTPLVEAFGPESVLAAASVGVDRVVAVVGSGYPDPFNHEAIWVGTPVPGEAVPTVGEEGVGPEVVMGGPAPEWERVLEFEEQGFRAMLATPSGLWAIAGDHPYEFDPSLLWHSTDGLAWSQLDTAALLGEGAIVSVIVEGGPGLLAAGSVPFGNTRVAVVWASVDGEEWTMTPLGYVFPEQEEPHLVPHLWMDGLAAGPRGAVIAATASMGFDYSQLEPSVMAALPATLRDFVSGDGVMIDPERISLSVGPFQVLSEAVSDLAVDQDLFDAYGRMVFGETEDRRLLFVTDDYSTWQQIDEWPGGEVPPAALTATDDGYLMTTGAWGNDPAAFASLDGLTWEGTELPGDPGTVRWFGSAEGRLLMAGTLGGRSTVWESADGGSSWTAWAGSPVDAWDVRVGGFGLVATGDHPSEWWSSSSWAPMVVERNGLTLSIQEGRDGCSVSDAGGETLFTGACMPAGTGFGLGLPEMIRADNERAVFTVVDPSTAATLMTVSYREMDDAFATAQDRARVGPDLFVAYSGDGRVWSEQPVRDVVGSAGWVGPVAVGEDFAVVVVHEPDGPVSLWRATIR